MSPETDYASEKEREYIGRLSIFANFYKLLYFRRIMTIRTWMVLASVCFAPVVVAADETQWLIAPYGWLPSVSVDQTFDDGTGGGGAEVLSKVDFAAMLRAAGSTSVYCSASDST